MIRIVTNTEVFEYEVRGLTMAYFPSVPISYELKGDFLCEAPQNEGDMLLTILRREKEDTVSFSLCFIREQETWKKEAAITRFSSMKEQKTLLKQLLYNLYRESTKRSLPWGTLTGIRPTKIPMASLLSGKTEEECVKELEDIYLCGRKKAELATKIAVREREIIDRLDTKDGYSLYLDIPFCPSRCLYCSFTAYSLEKMARYVEPYLEKLFYELSFVAEHFADKPLNTIYIGGGTPTTLTPDQLERLLGLLTTRFDLSHLQEFTVEAGRPDSLTKEKLDAMRQFPVSRISINPQTMNEETLRLIGRKHTVEDIRQAFAMARDCGYTNINMDMILGLPGEGAAQVKKTLEEIKTLSPDSLTVHALALKRSSRLNLEFDQYQDQVGHEAEEEMELTMEAAKALGLEPYYLYRQKNMAGNLENVGFSRPGLPGIYNILIMEEIQSIVACGCGAVSKRIFPDGRIERCENVKDLLTYLERLEDMLERKKTLFELR